MRFANASRILNTQFLIILTILMVGCSKEKAAEPTPPALTLTDYKTYQTPTDGQYQTSYNTQDPLYGTSTSAQNTANDLVYDTYQNCGPQDGAPMRGRGWWVLRLLYIIMQSQQYSMFSQYQNPWQNTFYYRMPMGQDTMNNIYYNNYNNNYQAIRQANQCLDAMQPNAYQLSRMCSMGYLGQNTLLQFLIRLAKWINVLGTSQYGWYGQNNVGYAPPQQLPMY